MSFDLSRKKFNALDDYFGVVMQQGRVQTDADWNTMVAQISRRIQAGSLDTFGPGVVPRETPDGFLVSGPVSAFEIGPGRIYVDGLLAENHTETLKWDARLAEISGTAKLSGAAIDAAPSGLPGTTAYNDQPYYPNPTALPSGENYLVYVDVWQRDITYLQDATLVDDAVGVDTTARMQTVWQVKVLEDVGDIDAATDDADIPGWLQAIHPSSARLSTDTGNLSDDDNPCLLPPQAGYKGLENQLYRVQVHTGGPVGNATFKWSRDNAVVATRISAIPSGNEVVVDSLGRDDWLGFHDGDWVEITDDDRDFMGLPGEIRRIQLGSGIDTATRTITLEGSALPTGSGAGEFPVDGDGLTDKLRNTRLIRWDQAGIVFRENESEYTDLDAATSTGLIDIPASPTRLFLEKGILVEFDLEDVVTAADFEPEFKTGDYWIFSARVNSTSIEELDRAPPAGIHHHFTKLAIIDDGNIIDCRTLWPPEMGDSGCACTVCVHPEGHNSGSATIQQAIDHVIAAGGGTVCLSVGRFFIDETIRITGNSVTLRGQGWQTMLVTRKPMELIKIGGEGVATNTTIDRLFGITSVTNGFLPAIAAENVFGLDITRCFIANYPGERKWGEGKRKGVSQAIKFTGIAALVNVEDCKLFADQGITGPHHSDEYLGTYDFRVNRCMMSCDHSGISFTSISFHLGRLELSNNFIANAGESGIQLTGASVSKTVTEIRNNQLSDCETGIRAGLSNMRILTNDLEAEESEKRSGSAIVFVHSLDPAKLDNQQTIGNRVRNYSGDAISVETAVGRMMVKQNQVGNISGAGFAIGTEGSVEYLSLENNQFSDIDGVLDEEFEHHAAVLLQACVRADISNNLFDRIVRSEQKIKHRAGISISSSANVSINGNRLLAVTPESYAGFGAGIFIASTVGSFEVNNNEVRRVSEHDKQAVEKTIDATWIPLFVGGRQPQSLGFQHDTAATPGTAAGKPEKGEKENNFSIWRKHTPSMPVVELEGYAYAVLASRMVNLGRSALADGGIVANGNHLDGISSNAPAVVVTMSGHCGLSDNEIRSFHDGMLVQIMAHHVALNHNRLMARAKELVVIHSERYVVMGNMLTGSIRVLENGASVTLPAPWDALNIFV